MGKKVNVPIGKQFTRWTVIGEGHKAGYWMCQCSCGISKSVRFDTLMNNTSTNCGCLKLEKWIDRNTKYRNGELLDNRFYRIWQGMNDRCNDPKYVNYHGRDIIVCERWNSMNRDGYLNFYHDMYKLYLDHVEKFTIKNTSIDRINNDGNYHPDNCRWATWSVQRKNSRSGKRSNHSDAKE